MDAPTTAYHNNCIRGTKALVNYISNGTANSNDPRIPRSGRQTRQVYSGHSVSDYLFIVTVKSPNLPAGEAQQIASPTLYVNPCSNDTYVMDYCAFDAFWRACLNNGKKYDPYDSSTHFNSIEKAEFLNMYAQGVDIKVFPCFNAAAYQTSLYNKGASRVNAVQVYVIVTDSIAISPSQQLYSTVDVLPDIGTANSCLKINMTGNSAVYDTYTSGSINFDVKGHGAYNDSILFDIPFYGQVNVPLSAFNNISTLGISLACDFSGRTISAIPRINDTPLYEYSVTTGITELGCLPQSDATQDLRAANMGFLGKISNTLNSMTSGILQAFGGNVAGGMLTGSQGILDWIFPSTTSNMSIVGGNISRSEKRTAQFILTYHDYIDKDAFQLEYGKPDGNIRTLSTIPAGYIQTANAHFNANGVPADIVRAAEAAFNAGVHYI